MSLIADRNIRGGKASPNIKTNYGTKDYYSFYKGEKGTLERSPFAAILRKCNKAVVEEVIENAEEYTLPHGIGKISFRKRKNKASVSGGKIFSTALVDWKKTMKLWEESPIARRNKIMVRYDNMHTGRYSFRISMFKRAFENKDYFAFRYKRSLKRAFAERILTYNKQKIEAQIAKTI